MKTRLTTLMMSLLLMTALSARADETVTVTATNGDISQNLDLKAVATVFGEAKDLEEFEAKLNNPETRISNLDLNGDGVVDYLRVVESGEGNEHLIILQAILAQDIYQDVATIFVEKDPSTQAVTVQIQGDEYIYGTQYIIEPVYITRPIIYDWFWGPHWYCWHSPWYWGYYPSYWYAYDCWLVHDYWHHIYAFHHHHPYCSYRYRPEPRPRRSELYRNAGRHDLATAHPEQSFAQRNSGVSNARQLNGGRSASETRVAGTAENPRSSATFGSSNVRRAGESTRVSGQTSDASRSASRSASASTTSRSSAASSTSRAATTNTSRSAAASSTSRSASASTTYRSSSSATGSRSSAASSTSRSSAASSTSRASSTVSSGTRSSAASSTSRSSISTARPSSSSSSARSSSSYSSGSRSAGSSYSGGSRSSSSMSSGSRSAGSSSGGSRASGGGGRR